MVIGGLEKISLIDYPDHLAAIIFTKGCNFRCHFCYNPMLVLSHQGEDVKNKKEEGFPIISNEDLFLFLRERYGRLDGVVITGGEPTMHPDLPLFIKKIKDIGYDVKLDTNGTNPELLQKLIDEKLVDYIAMDIKAPEYKYEQVVGVKVDYKKLQKSVNIIIESGVKHEFRTTVVPGLLEKDDFKEMAKIIKGADNWYLQSFKSDTDLVDGSYVKKSPYLRKEMLEFVEVCQNEIGIGKLRE